jgi:hypothetical protein
VHDRGPARLVECADPGLAALIAGDAGTRKHCMRAVPASSEAAFRRELRELGYLLAADGAPVLKSRRASAATSPAPAPLPSAWGPRTD